MPFGIYITRDWDRMSQIAADLIEADIKQKQSLKAEYVLGLASGNSPTGVYKHLAKGYEIIDMRSAPFEKVQNLTFVRDPETGRLG